MKEIKIQSTLYVYDSINEIPQEIQALMNHAATARSEAYAPYSNFTVGAALLLDNGEIVIGSNQENALLLHLLLLQNDRANHAGKEGVCYSNEILLRCR